MDQSYSESDVSLSPSQILDRLQMLRQWQLLQRGKLQKQQLQYNETSEITSSITELVSHFSNTTSYNTFRSLLQSPQENTSEISPQVHTNNLSRKANLLNVIDGISILNLSEESECINSSPISTRSTASVNVEISKERSSLTSEAQAKKQISLDDMPILSPKKDFESLLKDKLKNETAADISNVNLPRKNSNSKPFLKKGQGTARYGLKKNFIIQNTKSLPWRKNILGSKNILSGKGIAKSKESKENFKIPVQIAVDGPKVLSPLLKCDPPVLQRKSFSNIVKCNINDDNQQKLVTKQQVEISGNSESVCKNPLGTTSFPNEKIPLCTGKEKTWAALFTKEQDDFLRKLKQTAYYKSFASPAKSAVSDLSSDEQQLNLRQKREETEQNIFELIENKVSHESFAIDNSFFSRFIKKNDLECSGESTPLVLQKCLNKNPNLMHIHPDIVHGKRNDHLSSDGETCESECTECIDNCSSVSSCCSCKSQSNSNITCIQEDKNKEQGFIKKVEQSNKSKGDKINKKCHNDSSRQVNDALNDNIADMNSKLLATSELLKDRLRELEDEIETFRKENANLSKMKENIDLERQKFFEEKTTSEQKFNEEKVLSEYYLAEEKEKLNKQKQMYERYVRDIRGQLNKKEKDEIMNLKNEIQCLKEEIRVKDAKSTSTIARLRNQIKIMEKDKKNLEAEVEKCKKENKRLHHSNEITRRLSNLKYLEQINKKLANMATKDTKSEVKLDSDGKYRSYEIERQSRNKKIQPFAKDATRQRAKSVPNLNVVSCYAKYFSQKDTFSEREKNKTLDDDNFHTLTCNFEVEQLTSDNEIDLGETNTNKNNSDSEEENHLEKIYNERFKSLSPNSKKSSSSTSVTSPEFLNNDVENSHFFIKKSIPGSKETSLSRGLLPSFEQTSYNIKSTPSISSFTNTSKKLRHDKSPSTTILKHQQDYDSVSHVNLNCRTNSPISILTNRSLSSQKSNTVIHKETLSDVRMIPSPEPSSSRASFTKTNLNPIEIRNPDGTKELKFPNGNKKIISSDGKYSKFMYYNGDIKENFYNKGRIKYYYAETKTVHTTHPDGLEVLEFPDGHVEKRYKDGSSEIRLPNGSVRYFDPKNDHVREEWRFPDGATLTVSVNGEQRIAFPNGQVEVHTQDHKRREFPDGTIKLVYNDGTSETRYASGRVRIKDKHGNLIMDSAS